VEATTAVAIARKALGIGEGVPGEALKVRRLEGPAHAYYLVALWAADATTLACVNEDRAELEISARLPGRAPILAVSLERAKGLAGLGPAAGGDLVWKPCRASFSMLYPIWEVCEGGHTVYVDQQGVVWKELKAKMPGG